jgi:hypothetical protein
MVIKLHNALTDRGALSVMRLADKVEIQVVSRMDILPDSKAVRVEILDQDER